MIIATAILTVLRHREFSHLAPLGAFAAVMDAVKQSGITNVSIVTQPLDTKGSGK